MAEFHIVQPNHGDVDGLISVVNQGWRDAHLNPALGVDEAYLQESAERESSEAGMAKWHGAIDEAADSEYRFLKVAKDAQTQAVIGMINARINEGHGALMSLYVRPEWRNGGPDGLAQQLATTALRWIDPLSSDVLIATYNHRSRGFFRRNGYTLPGELKMLGRIPAQLWLRPSQDDE